MTAPAWRRRQTRVRSLLGLLALATVAANLGCAQFRARRQKTTNAASPALGTELPGNDIYARNTVAPATDTKLSAESLPGNSVAANEGLADASSSIAEPAPAESAVRLQPPVLIDPARVGMVTTTAGVPDGARLIASSRPVARTDGATKPPAAESTHQVVAEARQTLDLMTTYQLAVKRQERVNGNLLPAEDLLMSIRRSPKAARLTWVDGPHQGREVLYRADEPGGLMHVNMADSKLPLPRLAIAPDSPMVMKNSRHPITEAGLDPIIASMEQADQAGTLVDLGMQTPAPLDHPHAAILRRTENGDIWRAYFDPVTHLPALVECRGNNGDLLEYYLFQQLRANVAELASASAFDPEARWGPPRGLFDRGRARTASEGTAATTR